jgi:N-acyl homoserine lactone hydrolase
VKIHAIQTGTVAVTAAWREGVGVIVVDTGEDARPPGRATSPAGIRACARSANGSSRSRRSGPQLKRLGIGRGDVRWVVLTHLHTDHAGGLHHFPDNEIIVTRTDLEFASGLRGRVRGYVANQHWPSWFRPTTVELGPEPLGPFPRSLRLTKAGDVTSCRSPAIPRARSAS